MKFNNYLQVALALCVLSFGFVISLPTDAIGQTHAHDGSPQQSQLNNTGKDDKSPTSKGRYLGGVGGYETPIVTGGYEAPLVQPYQQPYVPPVQSYGSSYQAPIQSYGSSYQQPIVQSYQQPIVSTYEQPIQQTYQQPIQQSYQQPLQQSYQQSYQQPIVSNSASSYGSSYQQPLVSNYTQSTYTQPIVSSYQQPIQQSYQQSYQQPLVSNYTQSTYTQPIVSSYQQPIVSSYQQSYQQPIQQSYQQPIVSNYSTPVYTPQVSTYQTPVVQAYETPVVSSYSTPVVSSYSTPVVSSYSAPVVSSYSAPVVEQTYVAPIQQSYQQSYQQPLQQSYQQSYQQPLQQSYQQSYQQPLQQSYQQSYQQPLQQSYQQSYQQPYQQQSYQQSYQQPIIQSYGQGSYYKRQLSSSVDNSTLLPESRSNSSSESLPSSSLSTTTSLIDGDGSSPTGAAMHDEMSTSESVESATYVSRPQQSINNVVAAATTFSPSYISQPIVQSQPIYNNNVQSSRYLDIQPEFTQSWADFYQPPGYLPIVFRTNNNYNQQQQQPIKYNSIGGYGGAVNLQTIGLGYITTYGPINPAVFYVPVRAQYYYRVPAPSPYYFLRQGYFTSQLTVPRYTQTTSSTTAYKGGVLKRSLSGHEAAPYSLLVDHLAAAASESFTNVSTIECPPQPASYTCPQMLNLNKEELKKKICDYENVLTGLISFVPDTEKSQTRCGSMKILKSDGKNTVADLPEKMAIVLGKDCQYKSIMENAQSATKDQVYLLTKNAVPAGTKLIIANGENVAMLSAQSIQKEEISALMKSCPAKASQ